MNTNNNENQTQIAVEVAVKEVTPEEVEVAVNNPGTMGFTKGGQAVIIPEGEEGEEVAKVNVTLRKRRAWYSA